MSELTVRQVRLIERLLQSRGNVTLAALAAALGTSTRTVQRDLPQAEAWLTEQEISLHVRSRVGLEVTAAPALRERALARLAQLNPRGDLPAEERQSLLLQELLDSPTGAKLAYFSRRYGVTEATISTDLDRLEPWLKQRGLTLVRRPGFGIGLHGSERAFRRALVDALRQNLTDEQVFELLQRVSDHRTDGQPQGFLERFLRYVDERTVTRIEAAVRDLDATLEEHLAESALMGLVVHLALAVARLHSSDPIRFPPEMLAQLRQTPEWARALRLAERVSVELGITIPEDEVGYITMHLKGARLRGAANRETQEDADRKEARELARSMAACAEEILGAPLASVPGLIHSLTVHLAPTINRLRLGMEIRNPLLGRIKSEYPSLFEASRVVCQVLAGHLGTPVPEAEVGFVAMHLGAALERLRSGARAIYRALVVCPTGVGTSQMLASRLDSTLPELEVLDVVPALELPTYVERLATPPDLVLSTVSLDHSAIPVVVVTPLLSADDVKRVRQVLQELPPSRYQWRHPMASPVPPASAAAQGPEALVRRATTVGSLLLDLLHAFRLEPLGEQDPLAAAAAMARRAGVAHDPDLVEGDLRRRESLGSTLVTGSLQLLHARTAGVERPFVGLLRTPHQAVVVMLAPAKASPEVLEILGAISVALVEQESLRRALKSGEEEQIKHELGHLLQPVMFRAAAEKLS